MRSLDNENLATRLKSNILARLGGLVGLATA